MRLLPNEEDEVLGVAARWKAQMCGIGGVWERTKSGDSEAIYHKLVALKRGATAADVTAIIGNALWVRQTCDECGERRAVVLVGQEPDFDSSTALLCAECARAVVRLIESVPPDAQS